MEDSLTHLKFELCRIPLEKLVTVDGLSVLTKKQRHAWLQQFSLTGEYNKQMEHLSGLISVLPVKQRRSRISEDDSKSLKQYAYEYKVKVMVYGKIN